MFRRFPPPSRTLLLAATSATVLSGLASGPAFAQNFSCGDNYQGGNNSNWGSGDNWSGGVPTGGAAACIGANIGTVDISGTAEASDLYLGKNDTLDLSGILVINGTYLDNAGTIDISSGSELNFQTVTLDYGGTIQISGDNAIGGIGGDRTLYNVDNTIEGTGTLGMNLTLSNETGGTVDANKNGGALTLAGSIMAVDNAGLLEATNGGTLDIEETVNNDGGNITADGGTVYLPNSSNIITGGTLTTKNGGAMYDVGAALEQVTLSSGSTLVIESGSLEGTSTITNNGTISLVGSLMVNGEITLTGGGTINMSSQNDSSIEGSGIFRLDNVNNTIEGEGAIGVVGLALDNEAGGTILANAGTLNIDGGGTVTNDGTFEALAGSKLIVNAGPFSNFSAGTLTGGTYDVYGTNANAGTLAIEELGRGGGEIVNNDATIYLNGIDSYFYDATGSDVLSKFDNNKSGGSFTITNGRDFTTQYSYDNEGNVVVGAGSTMQIGPTQYTYEQTGSTALTHVEANGALTTYNYDQSGGITQVDGQLTTQTTYVYDGTFQGTGIAAVTQTLYDYGTVRPGDTGSAGTLTVDGNYDQGNGGILEMDLAGTGSYSHLDVNGTATLYDGTGSGDTLAIDLLNNFHLGGNEQYDLIHANNFFDVFANITLDGGACSGPDSDLTCSGFAGLYFSAEFCNAAGKDCSLDPADGDYFWFDTYTPQANVPEPGSLLLLGSGLGAAGAFLRLRKKALSG